MAKRLTAVELKKLYLMGTVYRGDNLVMGFEAMMFEHQCGNTLSIHTGDEIITVEAPLPLWMKIGVLVSMPVLLWALNSALKIAGF